MAILHRKATDRTPEPVLEAVPAAPSDSRDANVEAFIEDLRQFVLHRSLAATLAGEGLDDSPQSSLSMEAADLRLWDGWSVQGQQFLDSLAPGELLDVALSPYKTLVVSFCAWLGKWQAAMHRGALEELSDLQRGFRSTEPSAPEDLGAARRSAGREREPGEAATIPESWLRSERFARVS